MKFKKYINAFILVSNVLNYRKKDAQKFANLKEIDENYYRVDDRKGDGRGHF